MWYVVAGATTLVISGIGYAFWWLFRQLVDAATDAEMLKKENAAYKETMSRTQNDHKIKEEVDAEVDAMPAGAALKRLRDKWSRKQQ